MQADAARGVVRTTLATARVVATEQGLRGFWAGTGPSVIRVGLGAGMHFVLLEQIRWLLSTTTPEGATHLSNVGAAMSGAAAAASAGTAAQAAASSSAAAAAANAARAASGAAASTAGAAAAAAAAGVPQYRDTFHALSTIVRTEGVRGLFRGVWPTVLTNAPYSGLYYMFYTRLKEGLSGEGRPQAAVNFASGVVAAVAATLLTQPADVVRTRMQLGVGVGLGGAATAGAAAAASAWSTLFAAVRQQGPSALMIGAAPRILKRTTQTALVWTLYEELVPRISALGVAAKEAWEGQRRANEAGR
ncbi:hypothetical protein GPECTOR_191g303 [Gonium pectorale]|uniref:Uncharacterized protein n=1 Tax=Gonium pectorale TaxID=33097 RepID=A0A150FX35_GONPE|nr:hypothetical protein GPECTOR_191g303 [Gonium pectorale]|eukprot:KXZ42171.1 hypothetical protein GPECTOR_191g303 [Gonium pectorale]